MSGYAVVLSEERDNLDGDPDATFRIEACYEKKAHIVYEYSARGCGIKTIRSCNCKTRKPRKIRFERHEMSQIREFLERRQEKTRRKSLTKRKRK